VVAVQVYVVVGIAAVAFTGFLLMLVILKFGGNSKLGIKGKLNAELLATAGGFTTGPAQRGSGPAGLLIGHDRLRCTHRGTKYTRGWFHKHILYIPTKK